MDLSFFFGGTRGPVISEMPDPLANEQARIVLEGLRRRDRLGALDEESRVRSNVAADAYNKAIPAVIQSGFDPEVVAKVLQQYPEAAPLVQKAWDEHAKRRDEGRKTDATVYKDKTASLLKQYSQMAGGLADTLKKNPNGVPDAMIANFYGKMAQSGLSEYMPALPFRSWDDKAAVAAHLDQLGNAFYETSSRIQNAETGRHNKTTEFLTADRDAESGRHNRTTEGLTARGQNMTDARMRETNEVARETARGNRTSADAKDYAQMIEKVALPNLMTSAKTLNETIAKYDGRRIPGVGMPAAYLPPLLQSKEGKVVRSQLQAVANDLLKLYSGGAVTANEAERRATEMMASGMFNDDDLRAAWPLVLGRINAAAQNVRGGFSPEAIETYESRGGLKLDPINAAGKPKLGMGAPAAPAGEWGVRRLD